MSLFRDIPKERLTYEALDENERAGERSRGWWERQWYSNSDGVAQRSTLRQKERKTERERERERGPSERRGNLSVLICRRDRGIEAGARLTVVLARGIPGVHRRFLRRKEGKREKEIFWPAYVPVSPPKHSILFPLRERESRCRPRIANNGAIFGERERRRALLVDGEKAEEIKNACLSSNDLSLFLLLQMKVFFLKLFNSGQLALPLNN